MGVLVELHLLLGGIPASLLSLLLEAVVVAIPMALPSLLALVVVLAVVVWVSQQTQEEPLLQ